MQTPPVVSPQDWEAARQQLLVKEKAHTRARDALAAERRRMPWMEVDKTYAFEVPSGKASLLDLFQGRKQLILYRAFFEPGVFGWPDHACRGCSMVADQVAHVSHLNARDTTLVFASRAPQADIARLKTRMGWNIPWVTITDSFDADFGVGEWHGTNVFYRDGDAHLPHLSDQEPRRRADGRHLELSRHHPARPPGALGGFAGRLSAVADLQMVELERQLRGWCARPTRNGSRSRTPARSRSARRARSERDRPVTRPPAPAATAGRPHPHLARWLGLAATPTFAIMAVLTAVLGGGSADMLCSAGHGLSLGGMVPMYLLMSAFHSAAWLRLISGSKNRDIRVSS